MKFNKIYMTVALLTAALGFTACDDTQEYTPGAPAGELNIGFTSEKNMILTPSETEIHIQLTRDNTEGELTVPLQGLIVPECMAVPAEATFADGSSTADIAVTFGDDMKCFTEYALSIRIPEKYTQPYATDGKSPILNIRVTKEDFRTVANGTFYEQAIFKTSWRQTLEYSPMLGIYRIPDCFVRGTHWYFHFNGSDEFWFTDSEGNMTTVFASGYVYSTYGMIMAHVVTEYEMGYDDDVEDAEGEFYAVMSMKINAVTYGTNYEVLSITEWLEKPWENETAE